MMFFSKRSSIQAGISFSGSRPVEGALLNNPNIADDQNAEEHQHLDQAEQRELFVNNRPRKQENSLNIKDDEQNSHDVVTDRIPLARIRIRIDAAFIWRQLPFSTGIRSYKFRSQQGDDRKRKRDRNEQKNRNIRKQGTHSPHPNDDCFRVSIAWANMGRTAPKHSLTPLTLPGKLIISVDCRMPATARDRAARGVLLNPSTRISSAMPGTGLSITATVASGVTSRGESPVPPVVTTRAMP